jgi:hypothetical protein
MDIKLPLSAFLSDTVPFLWWGQCSKLVVHMYCIYVRVCVCVYMYQVWYIKIPIFCMYEEATPMILYRMIENLLQTWEIIYSEPSVN